MQPRTRTYYATRNFSNRLFLLSFFTLQPPLPPSGSPLRFDERRSAGGGSDDPDGFTSAESDDVKADGCKSYGGGGWKIKRGGHRQSGIRPLYGAARGGVRDGMNGKGTQGRREGHARIRHGEERVETGKGGREACGGSIIPVYIHSPHIHSGAKLLS